MMDPPIFVVAGAALLWFPTFLAWRDGARDLPGQLRWRMGKTTRFLVLCVQLELTGFILLVYGGWQGAFTVVGLGAMIDNGAILIDTICAFMIGLCLALILPKKKP